MALKYPILHMGCKPIEGYEITPVTNPNMKIDGYPVITSFAWATSSASGTVYGNSKSTKIDNLPVIIIDTTVAAYYIPPVNPTSISD